MTTMDKRMTDVEKVKKNSKSLMHPKTIVPEVLSKEEEWRMWKSDVEDYCQEMFEGMKDMLEEIRKAEEEINEEWFDPTDEDWWSKGEMLWRFLKRYTSGEAKRVVMSVREDNGWEAWKKLNQQYEPGLMVREAQVMARFTGTVGKRARNVKETKMMMTELGERAKRVEEITGIQVDARHEMSVIVGIIDPETLKHTAQYQGAKANVGILKRKILEFTNMMTGSAGGGSDPMELGRVEEEHEREDENG